MPRGCNTICVWALSGRLSQMIMVRVRGPMFVIGSQSWREFSTSVGSTNYHVGIRFLKKPISKQLADKKRFGGWRSRKQCVSAV